MEFRNLVLCLGDCVMFRRASHLKTKAAMFLAVMYKFVSGSILSYCKDGNDKYIYIYKQNRWGKSCNEGEKRVKKVDEWDKNPRIMVHED